MLQVETIRNTDYQTHAKKARGEYNPCIVCGRAAGRAALFVRLHKGGSAIVTKTEADELNAQGESGADMGLHPIGIVCLIQHPEVKPYAVSGVREYR